MTTKKIQTIGSAPRLPNWKAALAAVNAGEKPYVDTYCDAFCALFGIEAGGETDREAAILNELAAQRPPSISIYDRKYTTHVYAEPEASDGQVYEAMRDYAAQHATEDPAMRAVKRKQILDLLDQWQAAGPPSAEDDRFWRGFQADLAKTKRGDFTEAAEDLQQQLAGVVKRAEYSEALNRELHDKLAEIDAMLNRWKAGPPSTWFEAMAELSEIRGRQDSERG